MRLWISFKNRGLRLNIITRNKRRMCLRLDRCILLLLLTLSVLGFSIKGLHCMIMHSHKEVSIVYKEDKQEKQTLLVNDSKTNNETTKNQKVETAFKEIKQEPIKLEYRMTYYFPGDSMSSGATTASGKGVKDFQVNEKGWFTYKDKLVVATANKRLLSWSRYKNSKQRMFKLYDELTLEIQGKQYEAIVLDVCGAAMKSKKIDLFVKDNKSGIDTPIKVVKINNENIYA